MILCLNFKNSGIAMIIYSINQYGLREKDMQYMHKVFASIPAVQKVILYGSRATGQFEHGSDIDLAVIGKDVTYTDIAHIHSHLEEESPTLLWFDVLDYNTIRNENLKQRIDKYGEIIYER